MTIESLDVVFLTAIFVLPGFLINSIIDATNPPQNRSEGIYFLKCLAYSVLNLALWSWLYNIIFLTEFKPSYLLWLNLVAVTLVGGAIIALLIALIKQRNLVDRVLRRFHIPKIHSTPTAWDFYFSSREPMFVIVTLVDGTILRGWYSSNSFTSSDPEERDIYVEQGYRIDDQDQWQIDPESAGFYVSKEQIKFIEFKKGASQ